MMVQGFSTFSTTAISLRGHQLRTVTRGSARVREHFVACRGVGLPAPPSVVLFVGRTSLRDFTVQIVRQNLNRAVGNG